MSTDLNQSDTGQQAQQGQKFDGGKAPLMQGCMAYFPDALLAVAQVSAYGAKKYSAKFEDMNWRKVANGEARYGDADARHLLTPHLRAPGAVAGPYDAESELLHAAHHAWDALATLQLALERGQSLRNPGNRLSSNPSQSVAAGILGVDFVLTPQPAGVFAQTGPALMRSHMLEDVPPCARKHTKRQIEE